MNDNIPESERRIVVKMFSSNAHRLDILLEAVNIGDYEEAARQVPFVLADLRWKYDRLTKQ